MYSDYVCPFCYLGRRSLEEYRESRQTDLGIEWHPFDLRSHKRGPDGEEIRSALADGELRRWLDAAFREAQRQGVTGVPTFACDGHAARGAVPPEHLERLVEGD